MAPRETKKAKWWQKILLAILSPLIVIFLAEAVIRIFGISTELARNENFDIAVPVWLLADSNWVRNEYDRLQQPKGVKAVDVAWFANFEEARYIQYKLKPHIDVKAINPFNDIEVKKNVTFHITSNRAGFRTHEFTPKKTGTLRIVTLGDSGTFGWGVDTEYTWQNLLEKRLSQHFGNVEVFNRHGLGVLRHYALKLKPDLLILGFGANDGRYVLQPADRILAVDDTFLGTLRWTLLKLKTVQLLRSWIFSVYDPFKKIIPQAGKPLPNRVPSVSLDQYRQNLEAMITEAKKIGATSVLLSLCAHDDYARAMREISEKENLPYVEGKDVFFGNLKKVQEGALYPQETAYERSIYSNEVMAEKFWLYVTSDGCHPNRTGACLIADALADAVEKAVRGLNHPG
jgi:lysophospholipase L1-like esterase